MSEHLDYKETERDLSESEIGIVEWLLNNAKEDCEEYLSQLHSVRVIGECPCGCPSINFGIYDSQADVEGSMNILSDYLWKSEDGTLAGVFIYARAELLAGLEIWSVDGGKIPSVLPNTEKLKPFDSYLAK